MPDPYASSQPKRPRRFWLWAPYAALLVAALAWSGIWQLEKMRLEHVLAQRAADLRRQGDQAEWSKLQLDGWPFRLRLTFTAPRLADSAGWAVAAPRLEAQALAYAPDRWVLAAPDGLVLTRPGKGALNVSGRMIRASAGGLGSASPRFSFEGLDLSLSPAQGAAPASFSTIDRLELHLQPGPNDQAALLVRLDGAALRPEAGLAKLAGGKPFALNWDSRLTKLSALRGVTWPAAVQSWARAGGLMTVVDARLGLAGMALDGAGGPLSVNADGRLDGELPLKLDPGQISSRPLLEALGLLGPVSLRFKDGRASIGPMSVGAALKIG